MSRGRKLLAKMEQNPRDGWRIEDVQTVCAAHGVSCRRPSNGSHYVVSHESQFELLTVPYNRPIKPVYIKALVTYIRAVEASAGGDGPDRIPDRD